MKRKLLLICTLLCSSITFAQYTYVPDDSFEGKLQQLGLDSGPPDNLVLTALISDLETFNFSGFVINDITGLEDFVSLKNLSLNNFYGNVTDLSPIENLTLLEELHITDVEATSLDVSALSNLTVVTFSNNEFTSLDFSNCSSLLELYVGYTPITDINLSNNPLLDDIGIEATNLSTLDLSSCVALTYAAINYNSSLISVNISQSPLLEVLRFNDNTSIPYIDLSGNIGLLAVYATNNTVLETIFIKNGTNTNIGQSFRVTDNPLLACVEVDDVAWSNSFWGYYTDYFPGFSLNCTPENNDCSDATSIILAQPVSGTTRNATNGTNIPSCQEDGIVILDLWYEVTAPQSGSITLNIDALPLTAKIALYETCTDVAPLFCAESELLADNLTPNATYYIQVWLEATPENTNGDFIFTARDTATLSVNDLENPTSQIYIYPNPATNILTVNAESTLDEIAIYDMSGKRILTEENLATNSQTVQLETIASGLYMVQIKTANTTTLKKLIIK